MHIWSTLLDSSCTIISLFNPLTAISSHQQCSAVIDTDIIHTYHCLNDVLFLHRSA